MVEAAVAAAASANAAFVDDDYDTALDKFTEAIRCHPTSEYFSSRAAVHLKMQNYTGPDQFSSFITQQTPSLMQLKPPHWIHPMRKHFSGKG
jgi:hypothetical protein